MHAPSQILIPLSKKSINFPTQGAMQLRFLDHGGSQAKPSKTTICQIKTTI